MKKVLFLSMLALTSCAPLVQLAQPTERATLTRDGLSLVLTNPGPDALMGDGSRQGDGPALNVRGLNIKPDEQASAWCESTPVEAGVRWRCNLPDVPAGQQLRVTFVNTRAPSGIVDASVWAYRGLKPAWIWLSGGE